MTTLASNIGGPLTLLTYSFLGGPLADLTGTPTITILRLSDSTVVLGPTAVGVTHVSTGVYTYNWGAPSMVAGEYLVTWDGFSGVDPQQSSEIIQVVNSSAMANEPCSWALGTGCCNDWDTYSAELQAQATRYATDRERARAGEVDRPVLARDPAGGQGARAGQRDGARRGRCAGDGKQDEK